MSNSDFKTKFFELLKSTSWQSGQSVEEFEIDMQEMTSALVMKGIEAFCVSSGGPPMGPRHPQLPVGFTYTVGRPFSRGPLA